MTTAEPTLLDLLATPIPAASPAAPKPERWLVEHLLAAGHVTETGLTRRARVRACRCGAPILAGLDADLLAFEVQVDPIPLTAIGEALAQVEGRATFELWGAGGHYELEPRTSRRIAHFSPSTHRVDLLRAHLCRGRDLAAAEVATSTFAHHRSQPADTAPPF